MRKMKIILRNFVLFSMFLLICTNKSFGQKNVNISAGLGISELLNMGVRFQFEQSQLGFNLGTDPSQRGSFSISGDFYYHFDGTSNLSTLRVWYGKFGLIYLKSNTKEFSDSYLFLDLRIGRELNFSKKFGMTIDAGPAIQLEHTSTDPEGGWDFPVFPAIGLAFFYRF